MRVVRIEANRRGVSLANVLLALLARRPDHGYRLRARIAGELGLPSPREPSHVYAALAELERAGLVERRDEIEARRGCRQLAATSAGRAHLAAWLARRVDDGALLRRPLLMKVAVWSFLGERPGRRALRAERAACERRLGDPGSEPRGVLGALLRDRARRHLEVERWLLDRLAEPEGDADATPSSRPTGSASR